ncbi:Fic family protein [Traorella massiliensis]|uniref:Fic family protein n=1 Tax=Traorella massiliensis TaxID=1903263 RepID=UPI002354985C|nr:Fic family protein [Traorella massiliensis]
MDINIFVKILKDQHFTDYKKMSYKYGNDFKDFLNALDELYYKTLSLTDFDNHPIVFLENYATINQNVIKLLLHSQNQYYGIKAAEDEIISSSAIENIDFNRESVRNILRGLAPKDEEENRILGIKNGLEFIANTDNKITELNIYQLYMMTIGNFLSDDNKLKEGSYYRHDSVYIVSNRIEHIGLDYKKIPDFMKSLVEFINTEDSINDLIKAIIIHLYIAYIHPYFDGNGRMARLIHLWFLIQKGYQSTLFIPFSSQIEKSRKLYYKAYTTIEENKKYSGKIDVTPFILYFINNVYNKIIEESRTSNVLSVYEAELKKGLITEKETKLWKFVLSCYGMEEFSTKQLEKDYGDAAYATIRSFVLKFTNLGLLQSIHYGTRIKYKVNDN